MPRYLGRALILIAFLAALSLPALAADESSQPANVGTAVAPAPVTASTNPASATSRATSRPAGRRRAASGPATQQGPSLKLTCSDEHGLVLGTETTVKVELTGAPASGVTFKTTLEDFDGKVVEEKTVTPMVQENLATIAGSQQVKFDRFGGWLFKAAAYAPGSDKPLAEAKIRLVRAVPPAKLTPKQLEDSPIGMCVHAGAPWKVFHDVGMHWARDYSWQWLGHGQNAPLGDDEHKGMNFRKIAQEALQNDVMLLPILQQAFRTPDKKYFIEDTAAITAGYKKFAAAIPEVKYWELDNEAELQHASDPAAMKKWEESYRKYIPAAAEGLRQAGEGRTLVLNGDAGIVPERAADLLASPLAKDFGVINCHFYTGSVPPEISVLDFNTAAANPLASAGFLDRLTAYAALAHANGKQAWLTEVGYDETNGPAVGTRNQTLFLPRIFLLSEFCGIDKTFWFFDRDTNGAGIFSTMGLLDNRQNVRYIAASLAAVSKFIATAEYAGSIDLGEDQWCLAFRPTEGKWLVAAWTVQADHALPAELAAAKAFDVFGNEAKPARLTPSVSYFFLDTLPAGWEAQLPARWLTATNMTSFPGQQVTLQAKLPAGAKVTWTGLPKGVTVEADAKTAGQFVLQCSPELALGNYAFKAVAAGEGWTKSWTMTLRVIPPLQVRSQPYLPGEPAEIEIQSNAPKSELTFELPKDAGSLSAANLSVTSETPGKATFTGAKDAKGPLPLTIKLARGGEQKHWLRPRELNVPQVNVKADGDLADWPKAAALDVSYMEVSNPDFVPTGYMGWSEEGLCVAAVIPFREAISGRPDEFWDFPAFELMIDSDAAPHDNWPMTSHQFWFMPMSRNGKLAVNVGEWKRTEAIKENNLDVQGVTTAVRVEGNVAYVEAIIPAKLLGAAPAEGKTWRAVLSIQDAKREEYHLNAIWPQAKGGVGGLLEGTAKWGMLHFVGPEKADAKK